MKIEKKRASRSQTPARIDASRMTALDSTAWLIVGSGRVGRALASGLAEAGLPVGLAGRETPGALGLPSSVRRISWRDAPLPRGTRLVITVPDDHILETSRELASRGPGFVVALHTSGARPVSDLAPLADQGAAIGLFHPAAAFPPAGTPFRWPGCPIATAGGRTAVRAARTLARILGGSTYAVHADRRWKYHLGLTLAAAGIVTLLAEAEEILLDAGIPRRKARLLAADLATRSVGLFRQGGAARALTGAVVRGDSGVVQEHLDAARSEEEREFLRRLFLRTLELARTGVRISPESANLVGGVLDVRARTSKRKTSSGR